MITAIITDLDNTLLRCDSTISNYTVDVLKECQAKGIKIAFATARSMQASQKYIDKITPDIFIGYGGALVKAGEKIIHRFEIPHEIGHQIIRECLKTPDVIYIHAINETVALSNGPDSDMRHYQYTDFSCDYGYNYLKISLNACSSTAVENIASHFPMCDMLRYTGEDLYRFANRNAVKWNAVKVFSEYYGYDTETFVAFGDDVNDMEMIQNCGLGVAVKNAVNDVKSVAKYTCESNDDDGVAKWIEKNILRKHLR